MNHFCRYYCCAVLAGFPAAANAGGGLASLAPDFPVEFVLFAGVLLGVALLHRHTFVIALVGAIVVVLYKLVFASFDTGPGLDGFARHLALEWVVLANLFMMLLGFVIVARHFEKSHVPVILPRYLPDNWTGGLALLVMVFVVSGFLDNIAAAMIGGALAHQLFQARVHIGYLAAIVAASNAGGAGSVIGDTTTLMMWVSGVAPMEVVHAYVGGVVALLVFGVPAAIVQQRHSPIVKTMHPHTHPDWRRVGIVVVVLGAAVVVNLLVNLRFAWAGEQFPFFGATVWLVILVTLPVRRPDWEAVGASVKGSLFLVCLVLSASLMPVESLPAPGWETTLGLGFISAVFDNIPLTALAIEQGGYDWGLLAYAVGFGGSMMWFGSSAGVALTNLFPEGRSALGWLRHGWPVAVGYVVGFFAMLSLSGWRPH